MKIQKAFRIAEQHYQSGNLKQAAGIYKKILKQEPNNIDVLHDLGIILYHLQAYEEAILCIRKEIHLSPRNADAHNNLGLALLAKGELHEAVRSFQKTLQLQPHLSQAYYNLGLAYQEAGQTDRAIDYYRSALAQHPRFVEAYNNLGAILRMKGLTGEAVSCLKKALQINPNIPSLYNNLGLVLQDDDHVDDAIKFYRKALKLKPDFADAYNNIGNVLRENGNYQEALANYQKAIQCKPNFADAYNNMGYLLTEIGELNEAIGYYRKALEFNPNLADVCTNLGHALMENGHIEDAIQLHRKAQYLKPDLAAAYNNMGLALLEQGDFDQALEYFKKAVLITPGFADAHWNSSLLHLSNGCLKEGWKKYEWRWKSREFRSQKRIFNSPVWDGSPLHTGTLFVYAEQGVGDEIMFASCFPDLLDKVHTCIVECDDRLVPLFSRSFPRAVFSRRFRKDQEHQGDMPSCDFRIAAGSLPSIFRPAFSCFPERRSFLSADAKKTKMWCERFADLGEGLKIGIAWKGGSKPSVRRVRSTTLSQWGSILSLKGVHFVNLQYGDCADELREAQELFGIKIHEWEDTDPLKDLETFAAQIAALDLVISVDNATVHMAGALGKPVWTLLPFVCDWRWLRACDDTPWYTSVRLFRQDRPGDYERVFEHVASLLADFLRKGFFENPCPRYSYKQNLNVWNTENTKVEFSEKRSLSYQSCKCAVITPVGPGHEGLYNECIRSVEQAAQAGKGSFSEIIPIMIDDTEGILGRSRARNLGVQQAAEKGVEWIFFLDADDIMVPDAFECSKRYLTDYEAVWGSIWTFEQEAQKPQERPGQLPSLSILEDVLFCDPFTTLQMGHFVKTEAAIATPFDDSLDTGEDFDYYLRLWQKYHCIKIPLPLFYNRRGSHSLGMRSAQGSEWRRTVEAVLRKYMPGWVTSFTCHDKEIKFLITNPSDIIQQSFLRGEFFEIRELEFILHVVSQSAVIVEVGAHVGNHAIFYEKLMKPEKIVLIEPNEEAIGLLQKNIMLNGCVKMDTSLLGKGAGKVRGRFSVRNNSADNLGAAFLQPDLNGDVEVFPLDDLIRDQVHFIKIDAENMSVEILEGAQGILRSARPAVFIEVMNEDLTLFHAVLKKTGYHIVKKFPYVNATNYYIVP